MRKLLITAALLITLLASSCQVVTKDDSSPAAGPSPTPTSSSESTPQLESAGRWSYSNFPGLEATGFAYDHDGGLWDAIAITEAAVDGEDYLLLSFDPNWGPGENSRIFIFDATDPLSLQLVSSIAHPDEERKSYLVRSVAVQDGILYAGLFADKGLWMVDISDPANPKDLGITPVELHDDIIVSGDYAYASGQMFHGFSICDISDVGNVREVARQDISTRDCRLALSGEHLFVGIDNILSIYNVSTPSAPQQAGTLELQVTGNLTTDLPTPKPGQVHWTNWAHINDIQASGDYVYVAFGAGQVRVIDISDPSSPKEMSQADIGGFAIALTFTDNSLYVTKSDAESQKLQFAVVDISDPNSPEIVGSAATDSMFGFGGASLAYMWARPQIIGDYIYVAGINYFDVFRLK
jgi:hypothetical protein